MNPLRTSSSLVAGLGLVAASSLSAQEIVHVQVTELRVCAAEHGRLRGDGVRLPGYYYMSPYSGTVDGVTERP